MEKAAYKNAINLGLGTLLLVTGLLLNEWVIRKAFSLDGAIDSVAVRLMIWFVDLSLVFLGCWLIKYRSSFSVSGLQITLLIAFSLVSLAGAEGAVRLLGYKPWSEPKLDVVVKPGGKRFASHPTLGWRNLAGEFVITLKDGYSFQATHLESTLRVTHPLSTYVREGHKEEIWIFGCSVTYGWSLNDDETYCWLLQSRLPQYEIVNFGVNGYGTEQSLIQLREALKQGKTPKLVILAYAGFHDERSALVRSFRKRTVVGNEVALPYARIDRKGNLVHRVTGEPYSEFPLMRYSAGIHLLERFYNRIEKRLARSEEVGKRLLREFSQLAKEHGAECIVASIHSTPAHLMEYCRSENITAVDISVDSSLPENKNLPHDPHPSPLANQRYAQAIESFLSDRGLIVAAQGQQQGSR